MKRLAALWLLLAAVSASADEALDAAMADGTYKQVTSVLAAQNGEVLLEGYWHKANASTLHDTRSATKTLVALAIGAAIEDGSLAGVGAPVIEQFKAHHPVRFPSPEKSSITVRDLLTMTSALDCNDNDWNSPGNEEHMYPSRRWLYFALDLPVKQDYTRGASGYGPFSYCTAGSFLLGQVIKAATGQPVDVYFKARIQDPLGIETIDWPRSPSKEVQTGGGAEMTTRDLYALAELIRNRGQHNGEQLVPAAWIDEMTQPHVQPNDDQDYGYQIWRRDFACGDGTVSGWYMAGNGGNKVAVFKSLDLSVVATATLYGTSGMHQQTTTLIEQHVLPLVEACR